MIVAGPVVRGGPGLVDRWETPDPTEAHRVTWRDGLTAGYRPVGPEIPVHRG